MSIIHGWPDRGCRELHGAGAADLGLARTGDMAESSRRHATTATRTDGTASSSSTPSVSRSCTASCSTAGAHRRRGGTRGPCTAGPGRGAGAHRRRRGTSGRALLALAVPVPTGGDVVLGRALRAITAVPAPTGGDVVQVVGQCWPWPGCCWRGCWPAPDRHTPAPEPYGASSAPCSFRSIRLSARTRLYRRCRAPGHPPGLGSRWSRSAALAVRRAW